MKKYILALITLLAMQAAMASTESLDEAKLNLKSKNISDEQMNQVYDILTDSIKKKTLDMKGLLEAIVLFQAKDHSEAAYEMAFNLYKTNPQEFDAASERLSPSDKLKIVRFKALGERLDKEGSN